mgnify:CR=1 FL=1
MKFIFFFAGLLALFLRCQNSPYTQSQILSYQIATESCEEVSQITSGLVGGVLSGLANMAPGGLVSGLNTGSLGAVPEYWCDCFTYYAVLDLSENFTESELTEIREDKIKKFMVLQKLLENREEEIQSCIESGTQEIAEDYIQFARELDKKFK